MDRPPIAYIVMARFVGQFLVPFSPRYPSAWYRAGVLMLVERMDATYSRSHSYRVANKNENSDLCSPRLVPFGGKKVISEKIVVSHEKQ